MISKCFEFKDYNHKRSEPNYTTVADFYRYCDNQNNVLKSLADSLLWQPSTDYTVGQIVRAPDMPTGHIAKCTTAGKSSEEEPKWTDGVVTDGTVKWSVYDPESATNDKITTASSKKLDKIGGTVAGPISYAGTPKTDIELVNKSYVLAAIKVAQYDTKELIAETHHYIKRNTAYNVGDVLTSPNLPYGTTIVVTQAGTTGEDEPDWATIKNNIGGGVTDDGTVAFKTIALYEVIEYHDCSTLTVANGQIAEPDSTYWLKRGKWVYVNISGLVTNDGTTPVYVSGLPKPAYRVNSCMFSNRSNRCIGLFSIEDGRFASLTTGEIEQLYSSFTYITNS